MNVNQMSSFIAVCKCKSFSKAANEMFISQPALSKQIATLEEELGVSLIIRNKRGLVELTPIGEEYLEAFKKTLEILNEAAFRANSLGFEKKYRYRIGVMDGWMIPSLIKKCSKLFKENFPHIELCFDLYSPEMLISLAYSGYLDFIITIETGKDIPKGYTTHRLIDINSIIFVAATNKAVQNGIIDLSQLKDQTLFLLPEASLLRTNFQKIKDMLNSDNILYKELSTVSSIMMNVLTGNDYSISDEWSLHKYSNLFCSLVLPDITSSVYTYSKDMHMPEVTQAVMDCVSIWANTAKTEFIY